MKSHLCGIDGVLTTFMWKVTSDNCKTLLWEGGGVVLVVDCFKSLGQMSAVVSNECRHGSCTRQWELNRAFPQLLNVALRSRLPHQIVLHFLKSFGELRSIPLSILFHGEFGTLEILFQEACRRYDLKM